MFMILHPLLPYRSNGWRWSAFPPCFHKGIIFQEGSLGIFSLVLVFAEDAKNRRHLEQKPQMPTIWIGL
jgi:hypothetical protein